MLAEAAPEDIVDFMSVAGLPARAVRTPWLRSYLAREPQLGRARARSARCTLAFDCLVACGLRDGIGRGRAVLHRPAAGRGAARRRQNGLFFRGAEPLPFGAEIRPVGDLMRLLLTGAPAAPAPAGA